MPAFKLPGSDMSASSLQTRHERSVCRRTDRACRVLTPAWQCTTVTMLYEVCLKQFNVQAVRRSWMLAGLCRTQDTDADDAASTPEQICEATVHAAEAAGVRLV